VSTRQLRLGNDTHIAPARLDSTSLTVGADAALGKDWRAGAALHYDNGKLKINDRSSHSNLESVGLTLAAGRDVALADGQLNLLVGASYAWHRLKSRRNTGESGLDQTLKTSYNGNTSQVFGELGYALPLTPSSTLEPFAGLAWTRVHTKGFTESGGSAALSGQSQSTQTTASTLGLRTQVRLPMGSGQTTLHASAGWRHAFGDVQPQARLAFDGGQTYTVQGTPIARDAAVLGLGVAVNLSDSTTLGVNYAGQFGNNGLRDHAGELRLRWAF
jgi:outer membrane autotransporter protein